MTTIDDDVTVDEEAPGRPNLGLRWWREVVYIIVIYTGYSSVRNLFGSGDGGPVIAEPAFNHGKAIIQIERNIGLYFEDRLQSWYLDLPAHGLIRIWNVWYGLFHFVVAAAALILLFRRMPERYRVWRNTLAITTILALVGFASFSLMPPRLLDDAGIFGGCQVYAADAARAGELPEKAGQPPCDEFDYVDTTAEWGGWASFGSEEMAKVSNQYAAMPSMHIGWSTWCALVLVPMMRRRWAKVLAGLYPLMTLFVIIVTGNHYWIDGLGGLLCLGVGFLLALAGTRRWEVWRGYTTPTPTPAAVEG